MFRKMTSTNSEGTINYFSVLKINQTIVPLYKESDKFIQQYLMKQACYTKGNTGALPKISNFRKKMRRGRGLTLIYY